MPSLPEERTQARPVGLARKSYGDYKIPHEFHEPPPDDLLETFEGR